MLSGLLLHITTFLTSLGLGEWFGVGVGARIAGGRSLPASSDHQVVVLSNEIESWMAQPEQSISNMPFHLYQVLNALNGSEQAETGNKDPDRVFHGSGTYCGSCRILSKMVIGYVRLGGPMDIMANFLRDGHLPPHKRDVHVQLPPLPQRDARARAIDSSPAKVLSRPLVMARGSGETTGIVTPPDGCYNTCYTTSSPHTRTSTTCCVQVTSCLTTSGGSPEMTTWLLYKSVDPGMVLRWLVGELHQAEGRGELVHIIGHIAPYYSDCYTQWAHQFSRIVSRYSHIIRGQFYGHSHMDEFRVHYDINAPYKPIGVQYITPNNGPFHDLNPSYRVFYIDGDHPDTTRKVMDYETWVMNLTHANQYDAPHWYKLYSARRDLQLPSLDPQHWDKLVQRMARDRDLFNRYHRYQVQDSDSAVSRGCDGKCRRKTLCNIVEGDKLMPPKCRPQNA
ncbi:Sphingomyelin phosphodiesterase-like 3 [Homarus americanus]|uniref:Sphingomyelin phosphodiesterase-like 3 n=1 Tax=Homarus americanus TaxID=6706 RepID=A0A8J5K8L0_HOMAM|nr:Sphingomyelin phosphodiesterase-like 3 [Homarus americanus]